MLQHVVQIVTTALSGASIMLPSATKISKCDNLFARDVSALHLSSYRNIYTSHRKIAGNVLVINHGV